MYSDTAEAAVNDITRGKDQYNVKRNALQRYVKKSKNFSSGNSKRGNKDAFSPNYITILKSFIIVRNNCLLAYCFELIRDRQLLVRYSDSSAFQRRFFWQSLTFTEHIAMLTRSSYFQLRRLRAIRKSVSSSTFTSIVHAFVCSRIDYCNSLFVGLPKVRLSPLQSVLNAAARLIARLPRFSHISSFMVEELHWLPLSVRIQFKVLILVLKSHLGLAPKYLCDLMLHPLSATSLRPLRSSDRLDLFVPRVSGLRWLNPDPSPA